MFGFSLAASVAVAQQSAPQIVLLPKPCVGESSAKIAVFFSGVTQLNSKPVSLPELIAALKDRKKVSTVCYYRERPAADDAPPQTEKVLDAVIQARLPIMFYWDPQFQQLVSFEK